MQSAVIETRVYINPREAVFCKDVYVYVYIYIYTCNCMCVCMYIYIYIYMYAHPSRPVTDHRPENLDMVRLTEAEWYYTGLYNCL